MAGLVTAHELSMGNWRNRFESITVYQRGHRLGGKGASSRGPNGRIEEHGLHILLGYYRDTFRVLKSCYEELDRPTTKPESPVQTWGDAVKPSGLVGLVDDAPDGWEPWVTQFTTRAESTDDVAIDRGPVRPIHLVRRSLRLLLDFHRQPARGGLVISTSPEVPQLRPESLDLTPLLRTAGLTAVAAALELVETAGEAVGAVASRSRLAASLERGLDELRGPLRRAVEVRPDTRRTWQLVDLVFTNLRGIIADGLLTRPEGVAAINHLDYRDWLRRHGADAATVDQAIVRGMYDLVFAYEDGDPNRPQFSAGLGLELATRMLLSHDGTVFWKMQAGMGEIVFAPMYEVLASRGVDFRFFHRVDQLEVGDDGLSVGRIRLGRQVDVTAGPAAYRPLVDVDGLPCWPDRPDAAQLDGPDVGEVNLESFWSEWNDAGSDELLAGRDFDQVVFAISLGMVPHVAADLMDASPRWRDMVDHVATVPTQSFQLWLSASEAELGWSGPEGVTLSGFAEPFDTWASMGHLLPREQWPTDEAPRTIAYFCNVLDAKVAGPSDADAAAADVHSNVVEFLRRDVKGIWPNAVGIDGDFRWEALVGGDATGPDRLGHQYLRANVDPSDAYVQSLPGTDAYRLRPDDTGFRNLVVAGDWTDCGLNAGCVEAATRSGILAAQAVTERCRNTQDTEDER